MKTSHITVLGICVVLLVILGVIAFHSPKQECIHYHQGAFVHLEYCGPRVVCQSKTDSEGGTLKDCVFQQDGAQ